MRATAEDGVPPSARLPRDVWTLEVGLSGVIDLSGPGALAAIGLPAIHPSQWQWPAYQVVGEALWSAGASAVLAPSAAHVGHRVLCVFRTRPEVAGVTEVPPAGHDVIPVIPTGLRT
jgi:hypothetical protein